MSPNAPDPPCEEATGEHRTARGTLSLFGHEPTPAEVAYVWRSRRWRLVRAARTFAVAVVLAPLVALVPPHAPWALGALGAGAFLARQKLRERRTLLSVRGTCPRCGEGVRLDGPTRLRSPHPVPCEACHHEAGLAVATP